MSGSATPRPGEAVDFGVAVGDTPSYMEGTVIGTYRVLRKLGEGGMGAVYLAEHSLLGRKAAVKVLQPELSRNQDIVERFFNEAKAATAIADPGIVQIFDFGYHADGSAYIVMEFLEGEPLDGRIKRLGRLAPFDALRILRQVSSSLAAAHARGIVHRDLKPENIFLVADREVTAGERPKLLDFGIAKLTAAGDSKVKTHTAAIMGTPMYMSPEQCRGAGYVDHRSDLYSLGCVLYHLLVGRPPFDGEGVGDIITAHLRDPAPAPSASVPGIPPEVDALTLRLMAKSPDQRYGSASELAEAIGIMIGTSLPPPMVVPSGGYVMTGGGPPTTLSGSAGHLHVGSAASIPGSLATRGSRKGLWAGVIAGVSVATAAVVVIVATSGGGDKPAGTAAPAASAAAGGTGLAVTIDAGAAVAEVPPAPPPVTAAGTPAAPVAEPVIPPATTVTPVTPPATATAPVPPPATAAAPVTPPATTARSTTRTTRRERPDRGTRTGTPPATTTTTTTPPPATPPPATSPPRVPCDRDGDGIPDDRC